jgi:hypothetical protein
MSRKRTGIQVLDYAGLPEVVAFMHRQLKRLRREGYSTEKLERVTITNGLRGQMLQDAECDEYWGVWRIRSATNIRLRYPWNWEEMGVICRDLSEVHVTTLGHEVLHFLRNTDQIEGCDGNTPKERKQHEEAVGDVEGRDWLRRWRRRGR